MDYQIPKYIYITLYSSIHPSIHPSIYSPLTPGNYLYQNNRKEESALVHRFALKTLDLLSGRLNPASLECLSEMHVLAAETQNIFNRETILEELLSRTSEMYGKADQRNLNWLNRLALLKSTKGEFQKAKILQTRHSFIINQLIRAQDELEEKSRARIEANQKASSENLKLKSGEENGTIGNGKEGVSKQASKAPAPKTIPYMQYYRLNLKHKFRESEKLKEFFKRKAESGKSKHQ